MTATASSAAATARPVAPPLPSPGRLGAILAVVAWPVWLCCFAVLYLGFGAKPAVAPSPAEIYASYTAQLGVFILFGVLSLLAVSALAGAHVLIASALARATGRRVLPGIVIASAVIAWLVQIPNFLGQFVFVAAGPDDSPDWVIGLLEGSTGNIVVNAIAWSLMSLAVTLLAFALWRARVLPRAGLVVGIIGAVALVAILILQFGQPMSEAILLFVLGTALLRRRK